jgi:hypothetical protein
MDRPTLGTPDPGDRRYYWARHGDKLALSFREQCGFTVFGLDAQHCFDMAAIYRRWLTSLYRTNEDLTAEWERDRKRMLEVLTPPAWEALPELSARPAQALRLLKEALEYAELSTLEHDPLPPFIAEGRALLEASGQ